jgi:hypothetical protein
VDFDCFLLWVNCDNFAKQNLCIFLPTEDGSNRGGNVRRRKPAGSDLIKQWLKQVKVPSVDDRHLDVRTP